MNEDRIIWMAEEFEAGNGVRVSDPTGTFASLTTVTARIRREMDAAADLAGVEITVSKVGDEARATPVKS